MLLVVLVGWAWAHQPTLEQPGPSFKEALVLPDVQVSYAVYTGLTKANPVHWYKFKAKKGQNLYAQITVPQIKGLETFAPYLALVGPGFPTLKDLPFKLPEGWGAAVVAPTPARAFYEPFGRHNYWTRQSVELPAPQEGEFAFVVWHPEGKTGKYVFAPGREERFDFTAIARTFNVMPNVNKFMAGGPEFSQQELR